MEGYFWARKVVPEKVCSPGSRYGFKITSAVLDTTLATENDPISQVFVIKDEVKYPIANLSMKYQIIQTKLNLLFSEKEHIEFTLSKGSAPVYLYGYHQLSSDILDYCDGKRFMTEKDLNENVKPTSRRTKSALQTLETTLPSDDDDDQSYNPIEDMSALSDSREQKLGTDDSSDEDESEEQDEDMEADGESAEDEGEEEEASFVKDSELEDEAAADEDSSDDSFIDDSAEEFDEEACENEEVDGEEEESEEEVTVTSIKKQKLIDGKSKASAVEKEHSSLKKKQKQEAEAKIQKKDKMSRVLTDSIGHVKALSLHSNSQKKPDKFKDDKAKVKSHKAEKSINKENLGTPKQDKSFKTEKSPAVKVSHDSAQNTRRAVEGGVTIEEISVGSGRVVNKKSTVAVYYEGSLKDTGKIFDATLSGPPLKFKMGQGEVIPGMEVGVLGMKCGGKRKITIPPHMGYGKIGSPPTIPSNAILVFNVTVRSVR